ncbi:hypothetical protein FKM82_001339 [Ascaphus truei]
MVVRLQAPTVSGHHLQLIGCFLLPVKGCFCRDDPCLRMDLKFGGVPSSDRVLHGAIDAHIRVSGCDSGHQSCGGFILLNVGKVLHWIKNWAIVIHIQQSNSDLGSGEQRWGA